MTQEMPDRFNESPSPESYAADHAPADSSNEQHSYGIKNDSRTANSILLNFTEVKADTPKAICLTLLDYDTGELIEEWFPKKLCSNMNTVANTVHVWDVFMNEHKVDLIPPEQRVKR